jgi:quinoprotein relay system zinc metallohydrolase 2
VFEPIRRRALLLLWSLFWMPMSAVGADGLPGFNEIAPGVYFRLGVQEVADAHNRGHIANLGFIVGAKRVAVIDSGGSFTEGEAVLRAVRQVTDLPVAWLILTHMHPDHSLGAAAFAEQGIEIVGHANLGDALSRRREAYLNPVRAYLGSAATATRIVLPDTLVALGEVRELDLGGRVLQLRAYPTAHTNNDLSIYDRQTGLLWLSDLLFVDRIPVVDGSLLGWLRLIDGLAGLQPAMVVPGHGPVRSDWRADLERQRDYLDALATGVRRVIRAGGDLRRAVETVGQGERDRWLLFDDYHGRNVTAAFVELEWE